jgi:hypothetical protein
VGATQARHSGPWRPRASYPSRGVVHPAAIHPLTPGSPAYAVLKVAAIGSLVGLRVMLARRARRQADTNPTAQPEHADAAEPVPRRAEHPVSRRKARRRRNRR